jgi:hypothetical protein
MSTPPGKLQQEVSWYLSLVVLFLVILVPPLLCGLLYLSQVPDITWHGSGPTYDRIWLYRERRPLGIAYQSQRVIKAYNPTELCIENRLRFYLWGQAKEAEESTTTHKFVRLGEAWQPTGEGCD